MGNPKTARSGHLRKSAGSRFYEMVQAARGPDARCGKPDDSRTSFLYIDLSVLSLIIGGNQG